MKPEFGWLIENELMTKESGQPHYYGVLDGGTAWVKDHLQALRFARQEDASAMRSALVGKDHLSVTEHQWG